MHFIKVFITLLSLCSVLGHPISDRPSSDSDEFGLIDRAAPPKPAAKPAKPAAKPAKPPAKPAGKPPAKAGAKPPPKVVTVPPGGDYMSRMRKLNSDPNRPKPVRCKKAQDCVAFCNGPSGKPHFSQCDIKAGGWCRCENKGLEKAALAFAKPIMDGLAKFADVPVVKAINQVLKTMGDIKQIAKLVLTTVAPIPPGAKKAIGALFDSFDGITGGVTSHLDDITKGAVKKVLQVV